MNQESASAFALQALSFILEDDGRTERFLAYCGLPGADLKQVVGDPAFQGGILDYLLSAESELMDFCADKNMDPGLAQSARRALPGAAPEW